MDIDASGPATYGNGRGRPPATFSQFQRFRKESPRILEAWISKRTSRGNFGKHGNSPFLGIPNGPTGGSPNLGLPCDRCLEGGFHATLKGHGGSKNTPYVVGTSSNPFLNEVLGLTGEAGLLKKGNRGGPLGYRLPSWAHSRSIYPQYRQEVVSLLISLVQFDWVTEGPTWARSLGFANSPEFLGERMGRATRKKTN